MGKTGIETILVERSSTMSGGTINIGCIPTETLAEHAERSTPYAAAVAAKDELTAFMRRKN